MNNNTAIDSALTIQRVSKGIATRKRILKVFEAQMEFEQTLGLDAKISYLKNGGIAYNRGHRLLDLIGTVAALDHKKEELVNQLELSQEKLGLR